MSVQDVRQHGRQGDLGPAHRLHVRPWQPSPVRKGQLAIFGQKINCVLFFCFVL